MPSIFTSLYRLIPPSFRRSVENRFRYSKFANRTNEVITYYQDNQNLITEEKEVVINFLKSNYIRTFPYPFQDDFNTLKIIVFKDAERQNLPYVLHEGSRLYFKRDMKQKDIKKLYISLLSEQYIDSPHKYIIRDFSPATDDVIVDVGAAEGIFTLSVINSCKKAYLIEANQDWIEPLNATFSPWKDKVEIIQKFASNKTDNKHIALDTLEQSETIDFIKIDVEGWENEVLDGAKMITQDNNNLKIALCTYHKQDDAVFFNKTLSAMGFKVSFSKGYMLYSPAKDYGEPYLRRGLLRAIKATT